jgi:hypothetical protein
MAQTLSRRQFLTRGFALAGAAGVAVTPLATFAASDDSSGGRVKTWYALETTRDDIDRACRNHAANKLFADPATADLNRAHAGCNCRVVAGGELPQHVWVGLFGDPKRVARVTVDRRWDWVAKTLA